jgi:hypothetical protein
VKGRDSGFSKERSVTLGRNAALYFCCPGAQMGILRPFRTFVRNRAQGSQLRVTFPPIP